MKPISLKLSGLQSYREMQEIDFTMLCDTGLFGIFGPTGSGKSTILDAITLAMYGKVGRAYGGTQGIMNHSENSLFVSFTFELSSASGSARYRVERRFKRQNELSVSNTISRFIEITAAEDIVLADKLADVTRCVEDKIGLKMDDFTRAVVLPQGKFAEFLSLKGVDRRQMLQRLFHLEKYGDILGQKLARRVKETAQKLKELSAEQQGLGHASEEAVHEADHALKASVLLAETRRASLGEAEKKEAEYTKIRDLAKERDQRSGQLSALREQDEAISKLEAKLASSAAAEAIRPTLASWKESLQLAIEREAAAARARETAVTASALALNAAKALEAAVANLTVEEPSLLVRMDQLEQARLLQGECQLLLEEMKELRISQENSEQRKQVILTEIQKDELLLVKAQERQRELERLLQECEVKASERHQIQIALEQGKDIQRIREQLAIAQAEEIDLREKMDQATRNIQQISLEEVHTREKGCNLAELAMEVVGQLCELERKLVQYIDAATLVESELRQSWKEREQNIWVSRLKEQLIDNEPCLVCGSTHHSIDPAHRPEIMNNLDVPKELDEWTELLISMKEMKFSLSRNIEISHAVIEQLSDVFAENNGYNTQTDLLQKEIAVTLDDKHQEILDAAKMKETVEQLADQYNLLKERLTSLQQEVRPVVSLWNDIQSRMASIRAEAAGAKALAEQAAERIRIQNQEAAAKEQQWRQQYPDFTPESAIERQQQIAERDQKADEIKQRLALSVPFIEEKNTTLSKLNQDLIQLDKDLLQWQVQEQGKQSLYQEKQSRLSAWIGNEESVDKLWQETSDRLMSLRKNVEDSRHRQAAAVANSSEATQADALASQAAQAAREQEQQWQERWSIALAASPFDNEAEAAEAFVESELANEYALAVKNHRAREHELEISLRELDDKLAGRIVTEEEWEVSRLVLMTAKEQYEEALQLKARTERDLEDLITRHTRWKLLEQQRVSLAHEADLLGKLQSSLRGNAFVEYVAEEQLLHVSHAASQRLRHLTKQRYSLEIDSGGGFVISDDANGGVKRPVATLSGGETFLTSLALALALSAQIQLRGQYPLQFFFLDEGFGTLDPELLDTVITSLEHLHHDHLSVGIISHVAELRSRLARKLVVIPAESGGEGSKIVVETL